MSALPSPEVFLTGIKTVLTAALPNVQVHQFWKDSVTPPCIVTHMPRYPRDGTTPAEFVSVVLVGMTDEGSGQSQVYDIAIAAANAVDANHTLSGAVSSAWCKEFRNSRPWPVQEGRQRMWSVELVWDVLLDP